MMTYPDNTKNHYVTALSNRIELYGNWEVALSEILFQRTCYNIQEDECMLSIITPGNEIDMFFHRACIPMYINWLIDAIEILNVT